METLQPSDGRLSSHAQFSLVSGIGLSSSLSRARLRGCGWVGGVLTGEAEGECQRSVWSSWKEDRGLGSQEDQQEAANVPVALGTTAYGRVITSFPDKMSKKRPPWMGRADMELPS